MIHTESFGYLLGFGVLWLAQAFVWHVASRWLLMQAVTGALSMLQRLLGRSPSAPPSGDSFVDHLVNDPSLEPGAFGCVDGVVLAVLFGLTYLEMRWLG